MERLQPRRPRLVEVARTAGVSLATVDRVLNERGRVRADTVDRVRSAVQTLGYGRFPVTAPVAARNFDILLHHNDSAFYESLHQAFDAAGREIAHQGVTSRIHYLKRIDPTEMAAGIRSIARESDGLALVPLETPQVRHALAEVIERGIPVVTLLSDIRELRRSAYIGIDNRAAGRTAGYLMGRLLGPRAGKAAVVLETHSYLGHEEREMGFRSVIRERFPNLDLVQVLDREGDPATIEARLRDLLRRDGELIGIYNAGGPNAVIGDAVLASGRARDMVVVSHELTAKARQFLIDGVFDCVIVQDCRLIAERALTCLVGCNGDDMAERLQGNLEFKLYFCENMPFSGNPRPLSER